MATIDLQVDMVSYDHIALRWSVTPAPTSPVTFELLRSGTSTTGFEVVHTGEAPLHIDVLNMMSRFRPVYYRVRATIDNQVVQSRTVGIDAPPGREVLVLAKRERFQLAKYDGNPAWLFVKRQWGKPCPICLTKTHGPVSETCTRCYNTGFEGGFYPPIPIYVSFKGLNQERGSLQPTHVEQRETNALWTSNWSFVSSEDVIIEARSPFVAWSVEGVSRSAYNRSVLSQTLQVNTVERGSVFYDLPRPVFQWPEHEEIWYESFTDGYKAFDDLWAERVGAYLATNPKTTYETPLPTVEAPPAPISVQAGDFDPFSGGYR